MTSSRLRRHGDLPPGGAPLPLLVVVLLLLLLLCCCCCCLAGAEASNSVPRGGDTGSSVDAAAAGTIGTLLAIPYAVGAVSVSAHITTSAGFVPVVTHGRLRRAAPVALTRSSRRRLIAAFLEGAGVSQRCDLPLTLLRKGCGLESMEHPQVRVEVNTTLSSTQLKTVGVALSHRMMEHSSDLHLGFGSFVDKPVSPYINVHPSKINNPCSDYEVLCLPTHGYRHVLSVTSNISGN
ncbi:hypothetical protein CRUP_023512 [Coryphaenoides rupestris]|nr:hypothetical protein CRUP_023512 [Coryphaenoides rupestris]